MKITKLRIIGSDFAVLWPASLPGALGTCEGDKERITVAPNQSPVSELDTLLHEVIHAVEYKMGREHNEDWTRSISTGLVAVLRDNPEFVKYILKKLKG
jgi:hypothetical protein